jgi:hypothetical protein
MNAVFLQFPAHIQRQAKTRMNRVEVDARHRWMMEHGKKWASVATDGAEYENNPMVIRLKKLIREKMDCPELTMKRMRNDITEGRLLIEKRNRVKQWLAQQGADTDAVSSAESALFFLFDQANAR